MAWIMRGSVAPGGNPLAAKDGPPGILKRWSISEVNEDSDDLRLRGEDAPLRCDCRRTRGVVPPVLGVRVLLPVLMVGVCGRFL